MTQLDPQLNAVLDKVIVWRNGIGNFSPEGLFDPLERDLAEAVDAFLASRHTLRVSAEERSDDTKEDHGFGYGEVG